MATNTDLLAACLEQMFKGVRIVKSQEDFEQNFAWAREEWGLKYGTVESLSVASLHGMLQMGGKVHCLGEEKVKEDSEKPSAKESGQGAGDEEKDSEVPCPKKPRQDKKEDGQDSEKVPDAEKSPQPEGQMKVTVKTLTGKTIKIVCPVTETVGDLKITIQNREGIPPNQQRLIFASRQLEDNRELVDYGVKHNATLHLVLRLRGGYSEPSFLKIPDFFDTHFNYDFTNVKNTVAYWRGGERYWRPEGWQRLALRVQGKYADGDGWLGVGRRVEATASAPGEWPVSYHGTGHDNAASIADDGYRLSQGKRFLFGYGVYSTPDPEVAARYATPFQYQGKDYALIVQNRVKPTSVFKVTSAETGAGEYWVSRSDRDLRPYGFCLKRL